MPLWIIISIETDDINKSTTNKQTETLLTEPQNVCFPPIIVVYCESVRLDAANTGRECQQRVKTSDISPVINN